MEPKPTAKEAYAAWLQQREHAQAVLSDFEEEHKGLFLQHQELKALTETVCPTIPCMVCHHPIWSDGDAYLCESCDTHLRNMNVRVEWDNSGQETVVMDAVPYAIGTQVVRERVDQEFINRMRALLVEPSNEEDFEKEHLCIVL